MVLLTRLSQPLCVVDLVPAIGGTAEYYDKFGRLFCVTVPLAGSRLTAFDED